MTIWDRLRPIPEDAIHWVVLPGTIATGISAAMGLPPSTNKTKKEMAHDAAVYLREHSSEPINESLIQMQIDALRHSFSYRSTGPMLGPGEYYPIFSSFEHSSTVKNLEQLMQKPHTEQELREEINVAAHNLDNFAANLHTTYSPQTAGTTALALYATIIAGYALSRLNSRK